MVVSMPFGETVTHLKYGATGKDAYNKVTYGYTPVEIEGVGVDVSSAQESLDGTVNRSEVDLTIFLPAGTSYDSKDRFKVRGATYEVVGPSTYIKNFFTGSMFKTEVKLKRFTG